MNNRTLTALRKYANQQPSQFSQFIKNNPKTWSGIKWGGAPFLLGTSLAALLGARNPVLWGLGLGLAGLGYRAYSDNWFGDNLKGLGNPPSTAASSQASNE